MDIAATAAVIMTLFKKEKQEEKDDNKLTSSFFITTDKEILVEKQIENWQDDYISEEYINDYENGIYAWKYTKK